MLGLYLAVIAKVPRADRESTAIQPSVPETQKVAVDNANASPLRAATMTVHKHHKIIWSTQFRPALRFLVMASG